MAQETYKSWNIKGIAEGVLEDMKNDGVEDISDVLDDYVQDAYWSVYSREVNDAKIVAELVKEYIREKEGLA